MDLEITRSVHGEVAVLRLSGRLNGTTALLLERWLQEHAPAPLLWDLAGLHFLSSAGVRVLLVHEKQLRQRGQATVLAGVLPSLQEVLTITGLASFWQQLPGLPEMAAALPTVRGAEERTTADGLRFSVLRAAAAATPAGAAVEGALVRWQDAAYVGASVQQLHLAFGRGGLGARKDTARARPVNFACFGRLLSYRLEDGETDALLVADPATNFVRIEEAWSFTGPPLATVTLHDALPVATASAVLQQVSGTPWTGALLAMPSGPSGPEAAVALWVLPPASTGIVTGCCLPAPGLELEPELALPALLERLQASAGEGLAEWTLEALPAGTQLHVFGSHTLQAGADHTLNIEVPATPLGHFDESELIVRALYADCRRVVLTPLTGGFSATTWQVESFDAQQRRLLPTVLKVGPPAMMNRENAAHERYVRPFILNNASVGLGSATQGTAVGLCYNFVGVTGASAGLKTLARRWLDEPVDKMQRLYDQLTRETLRPWYGQARPLATCLYADHTPLRLFPGLRAVADEVLPFDLQAPTLYCAALGRALPNPWWFLEHAWAARSALTFTCQVAVTHGDLNLNNVLSDERDNLYVIDFSETRERSVGSDFARLEAVFLVEQATLETDEDEARFLRDMATLYATGRPWGAVPATLDSVAPERLAFVAQLRRLALHYLGAATPPEACVLPVFEWTLPIVLFANRPLRLRRMSTWVAALQLEWLQHVAQQTSQDLA